MENNVRFLVEISYDNGETWEFDGYLQDSLEDAKEKIKFLFNYSLRGEDICRIVRIEILPEIYTVFFKLIKSIG